jgi:hypothetical protein
VTERGVLRAGYRQWPVPRTSMASAFYSKRINDGGDWLYSVEVYRYDNIPRSPTAWEFGCQLARRSDAVYLDLRFHSGVRLRDAEAAFLATYRALGFEPYKRGCES